MANIVQRITTWAAQQVLKSADLNGEFNNLVNVINNVNSGSTQLVSPSLGPLTSNLSFTTTSTQGIVGTTTNDSAAAGNVGEFIRSVGGPINAGGNSAWTNVTTIALTAGDWDVTGVFVENNNSASLSNNTFTVAVSKFTAGTQTDHVYSDNTTDNVVGGVGVSTTTIAAWRVSVTGNQTIYAKAVIAYSAGTPQFFARLSARRVR